MKKKVLKIILIVFILLFTYKFSIFATDSIFEGADNFLSAGDNNSILDFNKVKGVSDQIFNIVLWIGIVIIVILGAVLGIKFMTGSVEEKADVKENIMPYAFGATVVFAAVTIWALCVEILQDIF